MGMKHELSIMSVVSVLSLVLAMIIGGLLTSDHRAEAQSTPTIFISDLVISEGAITSLNITLSEAPNGLAGFDIRVGIFEAQSTIIAQVQSGTVHSSFPLKLEEAVVDDQVRLRGVDLNKSYEKGAVNIPLGTIRIVTVEKGIVDIGALILALDDDSGDPINASISPGIIEVTAAFPIIVNGTSSRDNDGDGIVEDLNGNGRTDFQDIVLLFTEMDKIAITSNVQFFDRDDNGVINLADVVLAFNELL